MTWPTASAADSAARRALDVAGAAVGLALAAPLIAALAALVRLGDGGPAFYAQERVGRHGRPFRLWKLRTMVVDAERRGAAVTAAGDPRVTPVGRWLRRSKLDELPQLWNVLRGDMALVGPRPEVPRYVAHYTPAQRRVLDVRPGLTDPASLAYLDEEQRLAADPDPEARYLREILPAKLAIDLAWLERASVWQDVRVLARTVRLVAARLLPRPRTTPRTRGWILRHRRVLIVLAYAALVGAGYGAAHLIAHDLRPHGHLVDAWWRSLPLLLAVRLAAYGRFGLFRGYWQHFGPEDLLAVIAAATTSSLLFAAVIAWAGLLPVVSPAVLTLDWLLAIGIASGLHLVARLLREGWVPLRGRPGRRALVIGAGNAGERIIRLCHHDVKLAIRPVCLLDDDPLKHGTRLHGVPVVGDLSALAATIDARAVELIVIAIPSAAPAQLRRIVEECAGSRLELKIVPPIGDLLDRRPDGGQLRDVQVEDLLGRAPVRLDLAAPRADLAGAVVLVTGGAGSIGSELARQIARCRPRRLVLVDQAESALYFVQLELRAAHPELELAPVIADITDRQGLQAVFGRHRPQYVFHAAAYKHVPLMEEHVLEAVRNNVLGTLHVFECAADHDVRRLVLLSTDKAVRPSTIMGATKRMAERIVLEFPALFGTTTMDSCAVRFGNVLASEGSVVPLFRRQLRTGGPLTVTHPEVTRYFMTIDEAVQLVLQAAWLPETRGRVAMLDMGEPVRIVELAENLIRLSGLEPYRDVQIVFTGLRPAEKLHEDLMSAFEHAVPTSARKIRTVGRAPAGDADLAALVRQLRGAVDAGDATAAVRALKAGVPECVAPLRDARTSGELAVLPPGAGPSLVPARERVAAAVRPALPAAPLPHERGRAGLDLR